MNKKIKLLLCSVLGILTLTSCGEPAQPSEDSSSAPTTQEVTDLFNRKMEVPLEVNKVVCLGSGSLRLYSYVADMNKLSGVELVEKSDSTIKLPKRPYQVLHQELLDRLPACGTGGPKGQQIDKELVLACDPDVIFTTLKAQDALDELTNDTGIPTLMINYGKNGGFELDDNKNGVKKSLELIGKVMHVEARVTTLLNYIKSTSNELYTRTKDVKDDAKKSVYLGALGNFGMHALDSSQDRYPLLNSINAINVLDNVIPADKHMPSEDLIDTELLSSLNPDVVLIDAGGINKTKEQLNDKDKPYAEIYNSWNAFKNDEVYVLLPYKVYYMQIENGLIDSIFAAKVLYPELFKDMDIEATCKEVYETFYGVDCYDQYLQAAKLNGVALNKFKNE